MLRVRRVVLGTAVASSLLACSQQAGASSPKDGGTFRMTPLPSVEERMTGERLDPSAPGVAPLVEEAKRDLARRLSPDAGGAIEVVEVRSVTWPDTSLGCPQPGMQYTQVQRDGALLVLRAAGRDWHYHSGGKRGPFLCEHPARGGEGSPPRRSGKD